MPDSPVRLPRRTFLSLTAATAAVTAIGIPATASASALIDRAAGPIGDRVLALRGGAWVLADESGAAAPTRGLDGAHVVATTRATSGFVAVGSMDGRAVIWGSPDGGSWSRAARRNEPHAAFTAAGIGPNGVLVLGSLLSPEGTPVHPVAAIRTRSRDWLTLPVRGLDNLLPVTAVTGDGAGWTAAAVDLSGTTTFRSPNGFSWTRDTRVPASAIRELVGERWVGNALDDTAPLAGTLAGGRDIVDVPRDSHAVGGGFWLSQGRIVRGSR